MKRYHVAGRQFEFAYPVPELQQFEAATIEPSQTDGVFDAVPFTENRFSPSSFQTLACQTVGLVGGQNRRVETWITSPGRLMKVEGGNDFHISQDGKTIERVTEQGQELPPSFTQLDRMTLVGPALVLALALRGVWALHASAVQLAGCAVIFLGESGRGKSTLAAYLSSSLPRLADDILPVTFNETEMTAWPHFPQLKLPTGAHPGDSLPKSVPVGWVCVLGAADPASRPNLKRLPPSQAAQTLLRHTAGARLFEADMLARHLAFCSRAARQVPVFQIDYPHRTDILPSIKNLVLSLI